MRPIYECLKIVYVSAKAADDCARIAALRTCKKQSYQSLFGGEKNYFLSIPTREVKIFNLPGNSVIGD